jgi:hypothetical protein
MPENGAALWIVWKRKTIHHGDVMAGKAVPNEHENGRSIANEENEESINVRLFSRETPRNEKPAFGGSG